MGPGGAVLSAEETLHLDTKLDDGKPTSGRFVASNGQDHVTPATILPCLVAAGASFDYNVGSSIKACKFDIIIQ